MPETATLPDLISQAQTTEEQFLRHIFVRDQMAEWSKNPLVMARADGVHYWDVHGKRYLDALSGIYVVSVGHNNRRVIEALHPQVGVMIVCDDERPRPTTGLEIVEKWEALETLADDIRLSYASATN